MRRIGAARAGTLLLIFPTVRRVVLLSHKASVQHLRKHSVCAGWRRQTGSTGMAATWRRTMLRGPSRPRRRCWPDIMKSQFVCI